MKKFTYQENSSFHQDIQLHDKVEQKFISKKDTVDVNTLLNRVKADKKNEAKKKIIFFCSGLLLLISTATLITFIK